MLSGCLAFALQSVKGFTFDNAVSYIGVAVILAFSALEKVDFVKDVQVAWAFPHASSHYAFLMWLSITLPTLTLLSYFVYLGEPEKFLPSFLGFAEVMREQTDDDVKAGDFMALVTAQN